MNLLELIRAAIKEDMPNGDVTTESLALKPRPGRARLKAKEDLVLSGSATFEQTMQTLEPNCKIKWHFDEGDAILKGQIICTIEGDLVQVLKAERVALNFIGHLCGIASFTRRFVKAIEGTKTKILDTRKTTPALRELEKRAVVHGGGLNHRLNLSTAVLIKDNHIALMGGLTNAVQRVSDHFKGPIEVEAGTLDQVKEAVKLNVARILLDNMNNEMLREAMKLIPDTIEAEASGNMTLERVRAVAETGVNFISVGAVTHSAPTADVSLEFMWENAT
jgi:nicotinate-nucleotide pyrophosphorylase (carboxylating)